MKLSYFPSSILPVQRQLALHNDTVGKCFVLFLWCDASIQFEGQEPNVTRQLPISSKGRSARKPEPSQHRRAIPAGHQYCHKGIRKRGSTVKMSHSGSG